MAADSPRRVTLDAMSGVDDPTSDFVRVGDALLPKHLEFAWPRQSDGIPDLALTFEVIDGRPQCRRVSIASQPGGREVRSADLRALSVEDVIELAYRRYGLGADAFGDPAAAVTNTRAVRAARRPRISREMLREVAETYRHHAESDGAPIPAIAELLGVGQRTARLYVSRAREAGLLGPALKGKAGEA